MTYFNSIQNGLWSETSTWEGGVVPNSNDADVWIKHTVTIDGEYTANHVYLQGGSLVADRGGRSQLRSLTCGIIQYQGSMTPTTVRLDGVKITCTPFIGVTVASEHLATLSAYGGGRFIIDDTGMYNATATLQDIKPEGCAPAYTRKVANAVRYLTMTVRIQRGWEQEHWHLRQLYNMAESPYQVLAFNGSCIIKGYIESIVYDKTSVGTAYHVLQVTIAEGQK